MPTANNKTKRNKNTFSSLDDNDSPAHNHGNNEANPSNETASPSDSDILRELAESMRNVRLDFEKYKTDNDARAKTFEEKLDNLSGSSPPNTNDSAQSGVSQDGTSQDSNSTTSSPPNVTPRQNDVLLQTNIHKIRVIHLRAKTTLLVHNLLRFTEIQQPKLISRLIRPMFLDPLSTLQMAIPSPFLTHLVQLTLKIILHCNRTLMPKILLIHKIALVLRQCLPEILFHRISQQHLRELYLKDLFLKLLFHLCSATSAQITLLSLQVLLFLIAPHGSTLPNTQLVLTKTSLWTCGF